MWWYTVRASGLIAWALLLGAVAWGLVLSIRPIRRPRPAWALDLHRFLGGIAFAFIGVHLVGLLFDTFVGFSLVDLFVPMASHWRPGAVAYGVVGFYLVAAVEVTSLLMRRLPRRVWHSIHLLSLVALVLVTVHAFTAGADASSAAVVGLAVMSSAVVGALAVVRVVHLVLDRARPTVRPPLPDLTVRRTAPATGRVLAVPPPPRDPRRRYDPLRDPLFLPRATGPGGPVMPTPRREAAPERAPGRTSLPSTVANP
jgi:DMSO/TMAO reductase YedYZ heme-binding membrane subunit